MSSAKPDETIESKIFTVLAVALEPVFLLFDTSIQMNPRRLGVSGILRIGHRGIRIGFEELATEAS